MSSTFTSVSLFLLIFGWHLLQVTRNTIILASLTTIISLSIALPLAFLLVENRFVCFKIFSFNTHYSNDYTPIYYGILYNLFIWTKWGDFSHFAKIWGYTLRHIFGLPGLLMMQLTVFNSICFIYYWGWISWNSTSY